MNRDAIEELRSLEDRHWWFRARRAAIRAHVDTALAGAPTGAILDVGCGTGANLAWLAERADPRRLVGLEPDPRALELAALRPLAARWVRADAARLPFADGSAGLVVCCDVLEHLDDDAAACRELARVLAPGGRLVATVPACPSLWSVHDEALGHRRRYRRGELEGRLAAAGLVVESSHGFLLAPWPLVWALRRRRRLARARDGSTAPTSDFRALSVEPGTTLAPLGSLLVAALSLEAVLLRTLGLRAGVSLVVRARRT